MVTKAEIYQQINALEKTYIFYTKREINCLPDILLEGEEIRALTSGFLNKRTVLAVCTNRRILFLDKGMFFGLRHWEIALDRIQSIDGEYLLVFGSIRVWDGASAFQMSMVLASTIDVFIKATRSAIDDFRRIHFQEMTGATSITATDSVSQLERLAKLREAGHITEDEFRQQKHKILSSS